MGARALVRAAAAVGPRRRVSMDAIIQGQARDRWLTSTIKSYTPDLIEGIARGAMSGNLVAQWQLFDLMEATWPRLSKNLNEIKGAVVSLNWTIQPWAAQDEEPSDESRRRARLIEAAVWGMRPDPTNNENDFTDTIRDLLDAWSKGIAVLEVDWEVKDQRDGRDGRDGKSGTTIAPRCTRWIHPRYWGYPSDGVKLSLNWTEIGTGIAGETWGEFPANKFLVGINKSKSGHPIGAALLRSLAWWWAASNFSAGWFLNFAQIFGQPIRWATYDANQPSLLETVSTMLETMGSTAWGAFPQGTILELKEAAKSAADNPQKLVVEMADTICDILLLRQTLTTSQGDRGSQALGTVHKSVRADVIEEAAEWAARVLNQQFIPAFCRLNFGDDTECPWFSPEADEAKDELVLAQRDQILASMGLTFGEQYFRERHNVPRVKEGEDTVGGNSQGNVDQGNGDGNGQGNGGQGNKEEVKAKGAEGDWRQEALAQAMGVVPEWLAPLQALFGDLERALRDPSKSHAEVLAWAERAALAFPDRFDDLDLDVLSRRLEATTGAAVIAGMNKAEGK